MKTVGTCMAEARKARDLTVRELADLARISMWSLYDYEKDRNFPSLMALWTLADALDIDIDTYIGRSQTGKKEEHP